MAHGRWLRATLLVASARCYSPLPGQEQAHAIRAAQEGAPPPPPDSCCGLLNYAACTDFEEETGYTIHGCFSDGQPTIGAVATGSDGAYECQVCGKPGGPACECTHDNDNNDEDSTPERYGLPCDEGMAHWCLDGPDFITVETELGLWKCMHNETDAAEEENCGESGFRACVDELGNHACSSPDEEGYQIRAIQTPDTPNSPFMCIRCGTNDTPECPVNYPAPPAPPAPECVEKYMRAEASTRERRAGKATLAEARARARHRPVLVQDFMRWSRSPP
jgi:hypothetical protein